MALRMRICIAVQKLSRKCVQKNTPGPESRGSVFAAARGSVVRGGPLSHPESRWSVFFVARGSVRDGPLSDSESHGSSSFAA